MGRPVHSPSSVLRRLRPFLAPLAQSGRWLAHAVTRAVERVAGRADTWTMARRRLLAGPLAVLGLGVVAFSLFAGLGGVSSGSEPMVSSDPAVIAAGEQLFNLHCSSCHGIEGLGSSRAPAVVQEGAAGVDFYIRTGRMPLNNPNDEAIQHHPFFTDGQINQLDSYVAALPKILHLTNVASPGAPGIPTIQPLCTGTAANSPATLAAEKAGTAKCVTMSFGNSTFTLNCAQCHQIAGRGGLLSKANVIPSLQNASLLIAGEAMRIGPEPMPVFGSGQLSENQVSAVAHYVAYLKTPTHPGGFTISGFGPVAEGFVGIVVGLGLLLLVSRLIGNRG
jgi:ubiquinol-cytochrome c reductase cytochrome c subunit